MKQITFDELTKNLPHILDDIDTNKHPYKITYKNHSNVIIMPESDYSSLKTH